MRRRRLAASDAPVQYVHDAQQQPASQARPLRHPPPSAPQIEELRKEIEIMSQNHERELDRKDGQIQVSSRGSCGVPAAGCCPPTHPAWPARPEGWEPRGRCQPAMLHAKTAGMHPAADWHAVCQPTHTSQHVSECINRKTLPGTAPCAAACRHWMVTWMKPRSSTRRPCAPTWGCWSGFWTCSTPGKQEAQPRACRGVPAGLQHPAWQASRHAAGGRMHTRPSAPRVASQPGRGSGPVGRTWQLRTPACLGALPRRAG
jgi:hypothetical protein